MKQICVIGLGQFGSHIARTLEENGVEVLAIDNDESKVNAIRDAVHQAIVADATDEETLRQSLHEDIDQVIISLGENMEGSILCALHTKNIEVRNIFAKASSDDHAQILRAIGIRDILFPERETAERLAMKIIRPNLIDLFPIGEGYEIQEVEAPDSLVGKSLAQSDVRKRFGVMVVAIRRPRSDQMIFMPEGALAIQRGDLLVALGRTEKLDVFREAD